MLRVVVATEADLIVSLVEVLPTPLNEKAKGVREGEMEKQSGKRKKEDRALSQIVSAKIWLRLSSPFPSRPRLSL